ncbi:TIGR04104 family putative zinc finger protein [Salipaludibacillus sp. CUR1]|uniref:TIGR04104 family putative zinc finger protein n=1 Tax=Salipaludibacillus sp. CUR1 TaxID=2820003 RepID=UPI00351CCDC4
MPICQNCNKEWSWKQTQKSQSVLDTGMKCSYCRKKQQLTARSRKRIFLSCIIILLPMLLPIFNVSPLLTFISIFIMGALVLLLHPFYIDVSNDETTLWEQSRFTNRKL